MWQSRVLTAHLLDRADVFGGYHGLAWVTFTDPEVGRVGMTEQQARDAGLTVRVGVQQIASNSRGWIHGRGQRRLRQAGRGRRRAACSSARPSSARTAASCSACSPSPCTPKVPTHTLATMHYAFPTLHRAVLEAVQALA